MDELDLGAFVTFHTRADAETAIRSLTGVGAARRQGHAPPRRGRSQKARARRGLRRRRERAAADVAAGRGAQGKAAPPPGVSSGRSATSTNPDALGAKPDAAEQG